MDITSQTFERDVLSASADVPVLVDFWAPWCGPCRVVGPLLERLHAEAAGRWRLVKVDTDREPQLAQAFRITSIPALKLFRNGKVVAEVVGALPEPALRRWLDEHIPSETRMLLDAARKARADDNPAEARRLLEQVLAQDPDHGEARLELAEVVMADAPARAIELIGSLTDDLQLGERAAALSTLAQLLQRPVQRDGAEGAEARYLEGIDHLQRGDYQAGLEAWIDVVRRDRSIDDDGARRASVALFQWLGDDHPVTRAMRPKFASALF